MGYIANFIVYTLAMVGVIVFALFVFKTATTGAGNKSSKHLKVLDSMSLGQRKMLYIVSAGREKFLIAGDVDKTSLISKLELDENDCSLMRNTVKEERGESKLSFQDTMKDLSRVSYMDRSIIGKPRQKAGEGGIKTSVMRNLAERMKK